MALKHDSATGATDFPTFERLQESEWTVLVMLDFWMSLTLNSSSRKCQHKVDSDVLSFLSDQSVEDSLSAKKN